jgi:hypothetical protein
VNILIDSLGLQARVHLRDGRRLADLLAALAAAPGFRVAFSPSAPLTAGVLKGRDVLMLTTRKKADADYAEAEIASIQGFVQRGGGLLLMSNHGDIPGRPYPDLTASDARLAGRFGIEIENAFFASTEWGRAVEIREESLSHDHPVLRGIAAANPVRSLVINNCSSIRPGAGVALAFLPETMLDHRDGRSPRSRCLAVALDQRASGGRVVVTADSGFIGSEGTTFPGTGLIAMGDNRRFIVNILLWLGGA